MQDPVNPRPSQPAGFRCDVSALLIEHEDRLLSRIRWMMGTAGRDVAESCDFLSELSAKVLEDAHKLTWSSPEHFINLATRIARRLIIDKTRRPRMARFASFASSFSAGSLADTDAEGPDQQVVAQERIDHLFLALEALPCDYQRVIELRDFDGLPLKAVAEQMGRTVNAATHLHNRARLKLGLALRQLASGD